MAKKRRSEPLDTYCEREGITQTELAQRLGMAISTTISLVNGNRRITAECAVEIEKRIGIPRETLRPDLFVKRAA